jgi:signal transduction histidine kinase
VQVDINGSARPIVDPEMMKMVFQNLLINGAHAMHSAGTIRVDIASAAEQCTIAVSDAGPGIPPEVRDKIFAPFFTTKARGTGLGLPPPNASSKRITDRLLSSVLPQVARP